MKNVLSVFDGMSCGQIALNRLGIKYDKYFASEVDKHAIKVTQANFPHTIQLGDITQVKASDLPPIDLLIGGSPCQGFSFAGKQLNFDDPRSALFFEFVRLLKECKPKYFLLENVRMKQEFQDIISEQLGVKPITINSSLVSAQNRVRLYWTNIPNITQPEDKGLVLKDVLEDGANTVGRDNVVVFREKAQTILATIFKENAKSMLKRKQWGLLVNENQQYRKLTPIECERLQTVPDNYTSHVSNTQRYKMLGNGWTVDVICHLMKGFLDGQED